MANQPTVVMEAFLAGVAAWCAGKSPVEVPIYLPAHNGRRTAWLAGMEATRAFAATAGDLDQPSAEAIRQQGVEAPAPTIEELEAILNSGDSRSVRILPNGTIQTVPDAPSIGTKWRHANGNTYTVRMITNAPDDDRYPRTVVYQGQNGELWSRRSDDWHRSMTIIPDPAAEEWDPQP